ncbi:MAG: glucokinase [Rubrivivax sp.]|nr:glucokinase [Rubrivivax sp.]
MGSSKTAGAAPPLPWIVADIGGTNARFAWVVHEGGGIEHALTLPVARHGTLLDAVRTFIAQTRGQLGAEAPPPGAAALAVATAIVGDQVELTNSGWSFSQRALQRELGVARLVVMNDFETLALALPRLAPAQLQRVGEAPGQQAAAGAVRAVIGPGTGLGVAGLAPWPGGGADRDDAAETARWLALPGEGGHATLAAADDFEAALLAAARQHAGHVSAERLLSGIGLPALLQAVAAVRGTKTPERDARAIVAAGTAAPGSAEADTLCRETLEHFCSLLGGFAGNVALILGARGGLYLGGGIVPRLGELFHRSRFRERFEAKGRFETYLKPIPTWLITDTRAALVGAMAALRQLQRIPGP